ncbi:MAG TPA: hypothetical protein VGE18_02350 [Candidatus Paceibacterota bacterium]
MKKKTLILIIIGIVAATALFVYTRTKEPTVEQIVAEEKEAVAATVVAFGGQMKNVPLTAEQDVLSASIKKEYEATVAPALITRWIQSTSQAPGRATSSPWPERIEVISMEKVRDYYKVSAEIIEMTSAEVESGTEFSRKPVDITVAWVNEGWKVVEYYPPVK